MTNKYSNDAFMIEISKCKDPVVFLGVAKILKVKLVEDEEGKVARDFTDIFADVMAAYQCADRKRRKELCKLLRESNQLKDGEENADNSENIDSAN